MAPSKLSDADKQDIIVLYKNPGETTSTLAERYGVSNSTISRLLKSSLPESEYSALIQQKRSASDSAPASTPSTAPSAPKLRQTAAKTSSSTTAGEESAKDEQSQKMPRRRTRSKATQDKSDQANGEAIGTALVMANPGAPSPKLQTDNASSVSDPIGDVPPSKVTKPTRRKRSRQPSQAATETAEQINLLDQSEPSETVTEPIQESKRPQLKLRNREPVEAEPPMDESLDEPLDEINVLDDDDAALPTQDDDYGDDEDDWDDGDDEDDPEEGDDSASSTQFPREAIVQIIPLTQDVLPKPCYLVVDRMAELVTQPLKSFGDLGPLPEAKTTARTLPVFDNHRVARRFTQRNQRVVKVPDGGLLHKTSVYLQAKGITHLLIDGRVYSLT
ncbi:MAG: hypothetical protein AAF215_03135 [Cyanobacteria bacterium P01_A01_bin.123]